MYVLLPPVQIKLPQLVKLLVLAKNLITLTSNTPPLQTKKGKMTAVVAMAKYGHVHHHKSSKKATKEKLI